MRRWKAIREKAPVLLTYAKTRQIYLRTFERKACVRGMEGLSKTSCGFPRSTMCPSSMKTTELATSRAIPSHA